MVRQSRFNSLKIRLAVACIGLVLVAGTVMQSPLQPIQSGTKDVHVTIFVHGIISVKPFLSLANFVKLVRDNIADSTYARTVEIVRKDPFFFQYHPMQEIGLREVDLSIVEPGAAATAYARAFHALQPNRGEGLFKYYTFGWSGLLSTKMRYLEAKMFYQSISRLDDELREQGLIPHYTVIAYSHGGNVAFKMGDVHENENYRNNNLVIKNLWLIGVPVLPDSLSCLHSPLFKEIVHIYSVRDRIQPLDCFAVNRFFSSRMFTQTSQLPLPANLTQIQLSIRRPINKLYSKNLGQYDDFLVKAALRNADPGHTELWSFGWIINSYREHLPFYPLPASVFMPFIVNIIRSCNLNGCLQLEIHPYCQQMSIKQNKKVLTTPFITQDLMSSLQRDALQYKPVLFSDDEYKQKILLAMRRAKKEKMQERLALVQQNQMQQSACAA